MKKIDEPRTITIDEIVQYQAVHKTFSQRADDTVKKLLADVGNDVHKALECLNTYMKYSKQNESELQKAKDKLEKMIKH